MCETLWQVDGTMLRNHFCEVSPSSRGTSIPVILGDNRAYKCIYTNSILQTIHEHLEREAEHKWRSRLMRKSTIEAALVDYNMMLDDAARSFQVSALYQSDIADTQARNRLQR